MSDENKETKIRLYSNKITEAYNYFKQKEYSISINLLNEAIKIDSSKYEAFYYLSIVYSKQRAYKMAVDYLKIALKKDNKELKIYQEIVKNMQFYDIGSAITFAEKALQKHKDYILCTMLATLYSNKNNDFAAEKYFSKSIDLNPNYVLTYCELVSHFRKRNKLKEAVFYCEKLVKIEPENLVFVSQLCLLYVEMKERMKAIQLIDSYTQNNSMSLSEIEKIAILYEQLQEKDKAMKYLSEAINSNTNNIKIYEKYLLYLKEKNSEINEKNISLLISICEKALLNSNPDINFMLGTALLYASSGKYKDASELYLKVISIDKQNKIAKRGLEDIKKSCRRGYEN